MTIPAPIRPFESLKRAACQIIEIFTTGSSSASYALARIRLPRQTTRRTRVRTVCRLATYESPYPSQQPGSQDRSRSQSGVTRKPPRDIGRGDQAQSAIMTLNRLFANMALGHESFWRALSWLDIQIKTRVLYKSFNLNYLRYGRHRRYSLAFRKLYSYLQPKQRS
jgi:hypothetical protein